MRRKQHITFCEGALKQLPSAFDAFDASQPWLVYWNFQALDVLEHLDKQFAVLEPGKSIADTIELREFYQERFFFKKKKKKQHNSLLICFYLSLFTFFLILVLLLICRIDNVRVADSLAHLFMKRIWHQPMQPSILVLLLAQIKFFK